MPRERIREDYLRILRFFRLTAEYGEGPPDAEGLAACVRERDGLARLSAERVRQELLRLLVAPRGPELVRAMLDYGLLALVLGAAPRPTLLARLAALGGRARRASRMPCCASPRWRSRCPRTPSGCATACASPTRSAARLARAAAHSPDIGPAAPEASRHAPTSTPKAPRPTASACCWPGPAPAMPPDSQAWRTRFALPERWQPPRFPVGGADVMALGVPAGPRVGEMLRALEAWWIAGDFAADEAALRASSSTLQASHEPRTAAPACIEQHRALEHVDGWTRPTTSPQNLASRASRK